jgi:phosphoesterase RecJ-like protein
MGFEEIKELVKILKEKDNFVLATHLNYDPDALGGLISLALILKKLNKNFIIYFEEELDEKFQFIPLKEKLTKNINYQQFNIGIILDCDRISRTGENFYSI